MGWEELRVEADLSGPTVVEGGILIYMSHMDSEAITAITVVVLAALHIHIAHGV